MGADLVAAQRKLEMDAATAMKVLAHTSMPLEVGDVEVDPDTGLRPRMSDTPVSFSFSYHGVHFDAHLPVEDNSALELAAVVGVIPYTIENQFGRKTARSIIRGAKMPNGRLHVDTNSRVHLVLSGVPEKPRTPVNVLSTVAALLMEAKPYLDLLEISLRRTRRRSRRPLT